MSALTAFYVQIKRPGKQRAEVVDSFEAMGTDAITVSEQHQCLCNVDMGDYVVVQSLAKWRAKQANHASVLDSPAYRQAMTAQINHPDPLTVACMGGAA